MTAGGMAAGGDFASAAVLRLVRAGLAAQGLPVPALPSAPTARLPLEAKRALLRGVADAHGPVAVLRIGDALGSLPQEPSLRALALAAGPEDLLARWGRLERCAHSRHRVEHARAGPGEFRLVHRSLSGGPPIPEEDLLILGLLANLFDLVGAPADVRAGGEGAGGGGLLREDGRWVGDPSAAAGTAWLFRCRPGGRRPAAAPQAAVGTGAAGRVRALVAADPARGWRLADLARALGRGPRGVQRDLRAEGASMSRLVAEARLARAAELLTAGDAGPAEAAFLCGFADQAHLTRAFRRHTGFGPAAYRAQFAVSGG
jgi:AraC-like DNA-binding protein